MEKSTVKYLGSAVDIIRIFLLTSSQCDVGDVLHWVGQGQQHLALLIRQNGGKRQMFNPNYLSSKKQVAGAFQPFLTKPCISTLISWHLADKYKEMLCLLSLAI